MKSRVSIFKRFTLIVALSSLLVLFQNCEEHTARQLASVSADLESVAPDESGNDDAPTNNENINNGPVASPELPGAAPVMCVTNEVVAFPGALGFGKATKGGRGGRIVHVTNTNNAGVGSLRWALEDITEPRIVVFDIEGRINLTEEVEIKSPYVTVAGQTAPGEGLVITGARISVEAKEVIIRGMRFRAGDDPNGDVGRNRDNLAIGGNGDIGVENVIVDKSSLLWSVDENFSIWGTAKNITFSNSIVGLALYDSIHVHETATNGQTAPHSMGVIIGHKKGDPNSRGISLVRNLMTSNKYRNPFIKGADEFELVNNYIFNPGAAHQNISIGGTDDASSMALVGNYFEDGRDTNGSESRPGIDMRGTDPGSEVYLADNFMTDHNESTRDQESDMVHGKTQYLVSSSPFTLQTEDIGYENVAAHVLENVGPRSLDGERDPIDEVVLDKVRDKSIKIIDTPSEIGGYNLYNFNSSTIIDSDGDGMPDGFENQYAAFGFDAMVADDGGDYDGDGYTNIEEYINGLLDGFSLEDCARSPASGGGSAPALSGSFEVEAEDMDLNGFTVTANGAASNGYWIQANGTASASYVFNGQDGVYDITVHHFDENDGVSSMSVMLDAAQVGSFDWDQELDSNLANADTLTSITFNNIEIQNGQVVKIDGLADGSEPLRTDKISFDKK